MVSCSSSCEGKFLLQVRQEGKYPFAESCLRRVSDVPQPSWRTGTRFLKAVMACLWAWVTLATLFTLTLFVAPGGAVQCFLCSYSPRSNSSRIDGCTDANFTSEHIESRSCSLGCESVDVYDINGELESFHRNCATNDTIMTNTCETYKTIILTRFVCSCDWSYCNAASDSYQGVRPVMMVGLVSLVASLQGCRSQQTV
ncbi:uncharacterized protein [Procambarus clarkii]|uniref:uncharacterized protein n=1 Tax=Procambarus clarkii TaxID=6728 RepID=UPI001E675B43|nr:uncharacterized protein LOC123755383 [Procambarus clarkii]